MNLALLASHNGSALDTIYAAIANGKIRNIKLTLIISNNTDAKVLQKADAYGIPSKLINTKTYTDADEKLFTTLQKENIDIIFLAGYMKKISPKITQNFKIINSHPALLPKFGGAGMYGRYVHEAVIASGERHSGVTIHEVNDNYDEGRIILQSSLTLQADETAQSLERRIKELEKTAIIQGLVKCLN
jgi:phosphoribosylglycinamide formyltransferase-1